MTFKDDPQRRGQSANDGQLTRKRMETFDSEVLAKTPDYLDRKGNDPKPFFLW